MLKHGGMKCDEASGVGGVRLGRTINASLWSRFRGRDIESMNVNIGIQICQIEHVYVFLLVVKFQTLCNDYCIASLGNFP